MKNRKTLLATLVAVAAIMVSDAAHAAQKNVPKAAPKTTPAQEQYTALLESGSPEEVVQRILAAAETDKADAEIKGLGAAMAASTDKAGAVLDALARDRSATSATVQAELLLHIAIGLSAKPGDPARTRLTDALANRATALLSHDDPFVRGIAEWAIAVRVANDNEHRSLWPRPDPPAWFKTWSSLGPDFLLDADYVRQAVVDRAHRTGKGLLASAADVVLRATNQAAEACERLAADRQPALDLSLKALMAAGTRMADAAKSAPGDLTAQRKAWLDVRRAARKVVMANPELDFSQVVYAMRFSCVGAHNLASYSYHQDNFRPGGDIVVQTGLGPGDPVRPVIAGKLDPGSIRGMDLWWGADSVVFAYSKQPGWTPAKQREGEPTHLYEIRLDGTGLRQLTDDKKWIDTEPAYLPDGGAVFGSDRPGIGSECGAWEQNAGVTNLYRVSADGKTVRRLTYNKDYDRYPHCLDNGLIAYLHWDYAERQFLSPHSIWMVHPDGTMADAIFKAHVQASPMSLRDVRSIPGSHKLVAIACGHHNLPEGAVSVVDPSSGVNDLAGIRHVTPFAGPTEGTIGNLQPVAEGGVRDGGVRNDGGLYQTPWALSERRFLVSYAYRHPYSGSFAVYYIDAWGNKELIHRDLLLECAYPMAVRKRPLPPILPEIVKPEMDSAVCYLGDVYAGMPGVARGTVKYLRISERVNWVFDKSPRGELRWVPSNPFFPQFGYWTWSPIRVVGTVPVAEDGSAAFKVPAEMAVYFQALDENFMEVRRMRSHVAFQRGEVRSCVGCHEANANTSPTYWDGTLAARQEPAMPTPPTWGDCQVMDYEKMVQPILDRHCIRCHSGKEPKAGRDYSSARDLYGFAQSYRTMFGLRPGEPVPVSNGDGWYSRYFPGHEPVDGKDWYKLVLMGQAPGQLVTVSDRTSMGVDASISQPGQFGSRASKLTLTLLGENHKKRVNLSRDEWLTLVTWVDLNAPYSATFFQKFADDGMPLKTLRRVPIELPPPWKRPTQTASATAAQTGH